MKIAILDDYQNVALKMADWTALAAKAEITVFNDHLADVEELVSSVAHRLPFPNSIDDVLDTTGRSEIRLDKESRMVP